MKMAFASLSILVVLVAFSQVTILASAYTSTEQARHVGQQYAWGKITVDEQKYPTRYTYKVTFQWETWLLYSLLWDGQNWYKRFGNPVIYEIRILLNNKDTGWNYVSKVILKQTSEWSWNRDPSCQLVDKNPYDVYYGSYVFGPTVLPEGNYEAYVFWRISIGSADWYYYNLPGSYPGVQSGAWLPTFGSVGSSSGYTFWMNLPYVGFYARSVYW